MPSHRLWRDTVVALAGGAGVAGEAGASGGLVRDERLRPYPAALCDIWSMQTVTARIRASFWPSAISMP